MGVEAKLNIIRVIFLGGVIWAATGLGPALCRAQQAAPGSDRALFGGFLYFAGPSGTYLTAVSKPFPADPDDHEMALALLDALMAGPPTPGLGRTFPKGTRVNTLFITGRGDAYVDLKTAGETAGFDDAVSEYLGIYSLVNTLGVNIPGIKQVKILVNGSESGGLGGHISLAPFFKTNMLIVK